MNSLFVPHSHFYIKFTQHAVDQLKDKLLAKGRLLTESLL